MSFRELNLKKSYSSEVDNIVSDFYIPVLRKTVEYKRLVGFFSSTSLAVSSIGILELIKNNGNIKIITSASLSKSDVNLISKGKHELENLLSDKIIKEIEEIEYDFVRDHLFALGWMLYNKKLELKIAVRMNEKGLPLSRDQVITNGIFHQKIGICVDDMKNILTFSGSINETFSAWLNNIEEFKVFRNWKSNEKDWLFNDLKRFDRYWNNQMNSVKIIEVPEAIKEKLIISSPPNISEISLQRCYKKSKIIASPKLYQHQKNAVNNWIKNNYIGIFEMATGTGKTYTAIGCVEKFLHKWSKSVIIISCPYNHLISQWVDSIKKFTFEYSRIIIADSSNYKWKKEIFNNIANIEMYDTKPLIIISTHDTISSDNFIKIVQYFTKIDYLLVADEVHGLGSKKRKMGFLELYRFRLGLSATPKRWFDEVGTNKIYKYFDKTVFEFTLQDALTNNNPNTNQPYLCPYTYNISFVSLNEDELINYYKITRKIVSIYNNEDEEIQLQLEKLLFKRAEIIKSALNKYENFSEILSFIEESCGNINGTIVYVSPKQIDRVLNILNKRKLIVHKFTMEESTKQTLKYNGLSQRDFILKKFSEGEYQVLVAMKCLDEGVDIPSAKNAILLSSSTNPREYIQRIGRVIRFDKEKTQATIFDIIVKPNLNNTPESLKNFEKKIFRKEMSRIYEIGKNSVNFVEVLNKIEEELENL